jgi:hypothetical protein
MLLFPTGQLVILSLGQNPLKTGHRLTGNKCIY